MEFAIVAPFLILLLVGIIELGMIGFANSLLEGGLREAARFGTTGAEPDLGTRKSHLAEVVNEHGAGIIQVTEDNISTLIYPDFGSIGEPEPYVDSDGSGSYTPNEPFTDINCNAQWDPDMGQAGLGGGGDVVLYQLDFELPLLTGVLAPYIGQDGKLPLSASIAVRNEPFTSGSPEC